MSVLRVLLGGIIGLFIVSFFHLKEGTIDPRLLPIVSEFFYLKNGSMEIDRSLTVKIGKLEKPEWIGLCEYGLFGNTVTISEKEFNENTEFQLHSTIFHELGHGVLDRGHYPPESLSDVTSFKYLMLYLKIKVGVTVPSHMPDGCPVSVMYPYSFSDYCYLKHFQEYAEELFDKKF